MDLDFFKSSLKYNASLTIVSVVILYLLMPIFENIEFISNNPIITLAFFLIAINALLLIALYTTKAKHKKNEPVPSDIKDNEIIGNKAKNIKIESTGSISGNKINDNDADGDLIIGQRFKNERE
ncbi:hypothetical protein AI2602V1_0741 [Citrobacter freundii]|uniref:hypothetical protein n=1 Tax=Citrobacter freundii TaxID=546 RepID=UPI001D35B412|nr:hypothetical protein [Citrobacter freundii]MDT7238662.1 hypothetical protein [Citrobacter freundii]CAE6099244.1 hypothetical protein AI2602V1_0741 [Citrobacter freundii]CAH3246198.1 hypothetical protein AI2602V1_0741 [Citrobacter freundii]CAH6133197.1 hypothetical protein AI3058V1_3403 [Citrobacter freundii]HBK3068491.1 hypothetical protein [Citrobacter freundii]